MMTIHQGTAHDQYKCEFLANSNEVIFFPLLPPTLSTLTYTINMQPSPCAAAEFEFFARLLISD